MPLAYLGFGTNLGDREENLRHAFRALRAFARIDAISSIYQSEPVGFREQPDFWNLVVRIETELEPEALLAALKGIERELGRRAAFRNAPRTLDIDILLYGAEVIQAPGLTVPHPRMLERAFVLRPLLELDPGLHLPGSGLELLNHLSEAEGLERAEPIGPGDHLLGA